MKEIDDVPSFGSIDADNDEYLLQSFEDHEAYLSVLNVVKIFQLIITGPPLL